jgi:PAS domain S-box-containing protein
MKKVLLVAEDDHGLNMLICRKLQKAGFATVNACSGPDAIELIKKESIDLMLLDFKLPGMDGRQVAEELKRTGLEVPFITMTGYGNELIAVEMMKAGAMDYLVKDTTFLEVLVERVKKAIKELDTIKALRISEKALQESEQKNKRILDSMKDPVFICSADHEIQYANPAFQKMTGKELPAEKCYRSVFNSDTACAFCPSIESLKEQDFFVSAKINRGNEDAYYQISISPVKYQNREYSKLHILRDVTELVQSRELAEQNYLKYQLLADNAIDMVWQIDLRMTFTYTSPSAYSLLGYTTDEIVGQPLWKFTTRKDFITMARKVLGAIREVKDFTTITFESVLLSKDGVPVPVEITGRLLKDKNDEVIGLQGSASDISERIAAQAEQRKQHLLLRTLIDNIPDQIYIKDRNSRFLLNNRGHQEELGAASQEEILHKSDFDFWYYDAASEFLKDEQKIIKTGTPLINKEEYKAYKDGSFRWTLTTKVPIRDENGDITGIAGINRDITKRKLIEEELFRSRYELSLRNQIANIFLTEEPDQVFHQVMKVILKEFRSTYGFFGYINERQELVCPSMTLEIFDQCSMTNKSVSFPRDSWGGIWGRSLIERTSMFSNQGLKPPEGHLKLENAMCVPILVKEELIGQISIANKKGGYREQDRELLESICKYIAPILHSYLTGERMKLAKEQAFKELKIAKEKAEESDKLKSEFLLNLSHELRTPLNAIIGFSKVMADLNKDKERNSFYASQINTAGQDLIKMVEDTIEMSKIQCDQVILERNRREIGKTLKEIGQECPRRYGRSYPGIRFTLNDRTGNLLVDTDHEKLRKSLLNLVDNAVKFTGEGTVEIGGYVNGTDHLVLYVQDSGIGIPEDMLEAVFEKFRKIEGGKILYRGSGLGLSISRGMVERLGGKIHLESAEGKGTRATITLPIDQTE